MTDFSDFFRHPAFCRMAKNVSGEHQAACSYLKIFNTLSDPVFILDRNGHFVEVNDAACRVYGYSRDELLTMTPLDFEHPDFTPLLEKLLQKTLKSGYCFFETTNRTKDGRQLPLEISARTIEFDGKVYILSVARDISERKTLERSLRDAKERFEELFDLALDGIVIHELVSETSLGTFLFANKAICSLLGYSEEVMKTLSPFDIVSPDDFKIIPDETEALANDAILKHHKTLHSKEGRCIPVEISSRVYHFHEPPLVMSIIRDISDHKNLELSLRESIEFHLKLFDTFPSLIWRAGIDGKCNYFNLTWLAFTGRSLADELGDGWISGVHPDDREQCITTYHDAHDARRPFVMDYRLLHNDGTYHWITDSGMPYNDFDGVFAGYIGTCTDINAQRTAEQLLRKDRATLEKRVEERSQKLTCLNLELRKEIEERKMIEEELLTSREALQEHSTYLTATIEEERRNIARSVHDLLGKTMTALKYDLSWIKRNCSDDTPNFLVRLSDMEQLIHEANTTIANIASELRPVILDELGLEAAVEWQIRKFSTRSGIDADLSLGTLQLNNDKTITINLYRILQEALSNILRHSCALKVHVSLNQSGHKLRMKIQDNGTGITTAQKEASHSFGIIGMQERARICGGNLVISSPRGKGTTITVTVPINPPRLQRRK